MTEAAIVTGASSGLGLEIARLLQARGMAVIDVSRRTLGDASRAETAQAAIAAARGQGELRLLVNCAGVGIYGPAGGGTIVNVLSTAALIGKPNETVYCAAKWGARGYTEALRAEAKGTGVRVVAAAPGGMRTPFWPTDRAEFMDAAEVAQVIVDAALAKVAVTELVIQR